MKVGDLVRIKGNILECLQETPQVDWPEVYGSIGVVMEFTKRLKRLYIPVAKVMVLGVIEEFDIDELELVNESR
jgi:hypothetical protein